MAAAALVAAREARAQSVSPPIAEYREKAKASFNVTNQSVFPLTVVLQVKGFVVSEDGELRDVPLDTTRVHVKLSVLSFRLQPRQTYTVFYEASADSAPAWFNIWNAITGARTDAGLNVRIELPHVVYLNQRERLQQEDVRLVSAVHRPWDKRVTIEFENVSPRIGRVQSIVVSAPDAKSVEGPAFPLFPNGRRRVVVPWEQPGSPARVEVRFDGFRLATDVIATDTTSVSLPGTAGVNDSSEARSGVGTAGDSSATR
ncbi:MAG: hypothetical protein H6Q77_894 [Gemmatimonadetes bacterium]|jgi:hypothetical protein|nr:hypothetical protein [Gemmatimonadota bacterium]